jgi:hypothetical protein
MKAASQSKAVQSGLQQIYEIEGFVIAASRVRREKGNVFQPDDDGMGAGASVVVVAESTQEENDSFLASLRSSDRQG